MSCWRWLAVSLVVLVAVVALAAFWPRGARPGRATFEQVRKGMSFAEVCATVGGAPGIYGGEQVPYFLSGPPTFSHEFWFATDSTLYVIFDTETDEAIAVQVDDPPPDNRSLWERIRARVRP
jgi:hypothetical protein